MTTGGISKLALGQRLLEFAERRLPSLTRLRASEQLPIQLHRRRIYVLPSAFGIGFAILLVVMQLGALNYANNPAILLTSILAAAAWMSLFAGFRSLAGLELIAVNAADCHAGSPLIVDCLFSPSTRPRPSLRLVWGPSRFEFAIPRGASHRLVLTLPPTRRGWFRPGRLKIWTDQPLGLFVIWSWVNPELAILIYPEAEKTAPPLPLGSGQHGDRFVLGDGDEYSGLRDYRSGDPQRQIAWKASARHDSLLVRESERLQDTTLHLDYSMLAPFDHETRIRRLTAWVLAAELAMLDYILEIPGQRIGPGLGNQHRHLCLRSLALLPDAP